MLVLLPVAFFLAVVALAFELGGFIAGIGAVLLFLLLAATAWKKVPRSRAHGYTGNQAIAGAVGGLGAVSAGALSLAFGSTFVHAVVATLHFSLAVIATILLIRASQEARADQNAV